MIKDHTLIFNKPAQRVGVMAQNWAVTIPVVIVVCIVLAVISVVVTKGKGYYMPGALIIVPLTFLFRKRKDEDVLFHVRKTGAEDFTYIIVYPDGYQQQGILDQYSYWYAVDPAKPDSNKYELYFEIISQTQKLYFKDEIHANGPPEDWPESDVRVKTEKGIFLMNGLQELAFKIDQGSTVAETIV